MSLVLLVIGLVIFSIFVIKRKWVHELSPAIKQVKSIVKTKKALLGPYRTNELIEADIELDEIMETKVETDKNYFLSAEDTRALQKLKEEEINKYLLENQKRIWDEVIKEKLNRAINAGEKEITVHLRGPEQKIAMELVKELGYEIKLASTNTFFYMRW